MHVLDIMLRALLGVPLFFYLPGYLADRTWLGDRAPINGIERQTMRVVASVLLTGWLALLAEIGWFSYWLLLGILAVGCAGLGFALRQRGQLIRASRRSARLGIVAGQSPARTSIATLRTRLAALRFDHALLALAVIFGILVARPFEVVRGGLDAGVYVNTGVAIARTGSIVQHDPIVAAIGQRAAAGDAQADQIASNLFGVQPKNRFLATRLRASGFFINQGELAEGRVVPQFFHLWPVWIAVFVAMLGLPSGLVATGAAGTLSVVLLGLIGRKIAGPLAGWLAAAFLALMTPQVWFSRMPVSEALTQTLLLAGLWAFMHFADAGERRSRIWWGALVGLAFGELALTRFDFPFALAPLLLLLLYVALTRRWDAGYGALALTLAALLIHSALHIIFISRAYFFDTAYHRLQDYAITLYLSLPFLSPELQAGFKERAGAVYANPWRLPLELIVIGIVGIGLIAAWRWPRPLLHIEGWIRQHRRGLLNGAVLLLGALAIYAYFIRPGILTPAVLLHPFQPENWLRLQGYVGAPIAVPSGYEKTTRANDLANMVRLGWYLSPLGVVLGTLGCLRLVRRLDRRTWLFVLIASAYTLLFVRALYGTSDRTYIYILRRYIPLVYPAFALGMAIALAVIKGSGQAIRAQLINQARLGLFAALTAILLLFFVVTGRTAYAHVEYGGALAQLEELNAHFNDRDIILVRGGGRDTPELVATPLTYIFGRNAFAVKGDQPAHYAAAFADQVTRWRGEGRRVFTLLTASGGDMLFPGYAPHSIDTWTSRLREFQQLENQKPKLSYTNELTFHLYELVPQDSTAAPSTLTYDDTAAQVAGFYPSEQPKQDQARAAWTNGLGILRLPASAQGQQITIEVAGGERPKAINSAKLCVDAVAEPVPHPDYGVTLTQPIKLKDGSVVEPLSWQELTCAMLSEGVSEVAVQLPKLDADSSILLRLRSEPWVPAATPPDPGQPPAIDQRQLGVRFVGATWGR